jgi:hypothetical protein
MEAMRSFPVQVILPDGQVYRQSVYACTKWHAIELLYSKLCQYQDNRSLYSIFSVKKSQYKQKQK